MSTSRFLNRRVFCKEEKGNLVVRNEDRVCAREFRQLHTSAPDIPVVCLTGKMLVDHQDRYIVHKVRYLFHFIEEQVPPRGIFHLKAGIGIEKDQGFFRELLEEFGKIIQPVLVGEPVFLEHVDDDVFLPEISLYPGKIIHVILDLLQFSQVFHQIPVL